MARQPYQPGAQVEHSKYGLGTLISIDENRIAIKFDDHGEKKFVTPIVLPNLKKSDRKPPAEAKKLAKTSRSKKAPIVEIEEDDPPPRKASKSAISIDEEEDAVKIDDLDLEDTDLGTNGDDSSDDSSDDV